MIKLFFKIGISLALIFYLAVTVNWSIIRKTILDINIFYYVISTVITIISPIFIALKYRLFIKDTSLSLSIPRLVSINFMSRFYALFVPTALGVEAVRWYKVTKNKQGRSFFLAATIIERLFFILTLIAFGTIPLFFYTENQQIIHLRDKLIPFLATVSVFLGIVLLFFLLPALRERLINIVQTHVSKRKESKINQFLNNFVIRQSFSSIFLPLFMFSLFWQIFYIFRMFFLFTAFHLPLELIDVIWMASLVLMLQGLPVSIAGLGIREGAYAFLFTLFGLAPEKGVLIGILFFTQMLIIAVIGGILEIFEK